MQGESTMDRRFLRATLSAMILAALLGQSTFAGVFFSKKTKPTPAEYVPELIKTLKTDGDEHKRCSAAEELRQFDPKQFPDMLPALIDALFNDKKPSVRAEAAQTLGKLRPVSATVGAALEQALAKDTSMRVRLQARSSILQYRWAGYSDKAKEGPPPESKEPPLAPELPASAPAAAPRLAPVPATATLPSAPRPLPAAIPVKRSAPEAAPAAVPDVPVPPAPVPFSAAKPSQPAEEKGPDLTPP
jgi:hypothetical protein